MRNCFSRRQWGPNKGLELTASSVRSCLAPASGSSSGLAFGAQSRQEAQVVSWARELPDIRDGNGHSIFLGTQRGGACGYTRKP